MGATCGTMGVSIEQYYCGKNDQKRKTILFLAAKMILVFQFILLLDRVFFGCGPYSLELIGQNQSTIHQCFSLTTNQHQPLLLPAVQDRYSNSYPESISLNEEFKFTKLTLTVLDVDDLLPIQACLYMLLNWHISSV
jgi:hypothetical protein